MRWGKTKVGVDFANCMALKYNVRRVLVVCPLSVIGVWQEEIELHTPPGDIWPVWRIVNYEQVYDRINTGGRSWVAVTSKRLQEFGADLIIVDESHRIGNPTTLSSVHLFKLGRKTRYRVIMTGTMFHRKPFYVFGQAKFYDPGLFGTAFGKFKERIAIMGGFGGFEVVRYRNLRWMMRKMRSFVYIEKRVPPSTPPVTRVLRFNLDGKNLEDYNTMEEHSVLPLKNGQVVISPIVMSKHLRCTMIAGGWIKSEGVYHRVGRNKLERGIDHFQSYADGEVLKVVVGCRFIPELADAAYAARAAGYRVVSLRGGMTAEQRTEARTKFRLATVPTAMVCQISAGKEGIDLSTADTMLFWSLVESYVDHDQFTQRIAKFKETRVLQYDFLVADGTRDEINYLAIQQKKDVAQYMEDNPRMVEKVTAKSRSVAVL